MNPNNTSNNYHPHKKQLSLSLFLCLAAISITGCEVDSFMDQSVTGRWEATPIILPILDRLDIIEDAEPDIPGLSQITPADLIPEISEYVLGTGDVIVVSIPDLITHGADSVEQRRLDELGNIRLPIIGQIQASGLTPKQLEQEIINILDPDILINPMVSVMVIDARQKTYSIIENVRQPGTYNISKNDLRLLEALSNAGGYATDIETIYVIRQIPLSDLVDKGTRADKTSPGYHLPPAQPTDSQQTTQDKQTDQTFDPLKLIEDLQGEMDNTLDQPAKIEELPEIDTTPTPTDNDNAKNDSPLERAIESAPSTQTRWIHLDGKWVQVEADQVPIAQQQDTANAEELPALDQLVTQRVIEINARELFRGIAKYNIVIRPRDIIRVPAPRSGLYYMGGPGIARGGTYSMNDEKEVTLTRAVTAAGGLNAIGVPSRVEIRRDLGDDTQAIMRINYKAIAEGLQPDIYLKANDQINVGTNLPASFAAVFRNSFRASYGFGFLLDRNFGRDVFGAPPAETR